jgi:hypothetical protein
MRQEERSTVEPGFIHRRLKFPLLERDDRVALAERINQSTPANVDFVVIGAMLVAPLMGPLLGAGLALVQGNLRLFRAASFAIGIGAVIGLVVSLILGLLNPGYEPQ